MAARCFPSGIENVEYEARRLIAAAEKQAIGRAAADLIPDNASLFINIGTTTEAVGEALLRPSRPDGHHQQHQCRQPLCGVYPQIEVVIAGGVVRGSDGGIVGEAAVDFIRQFKVDFAVIGASAIDDDGALLDFDFREVKVAQAIIANARHVILVSDSLEIRAHRAGADRPSLPGPHLHHRPLPVPEIRADLRANIRVRLIETRRRANRLRRGCRHRAAQSNFV